MNKKLTGIELLKHIGKFLGPIETEKAITYLKQQETEWINLYGRLKSKGLIIDFNIFKEKCHTQAISSTKSAIDIALDYEKSINLDWDDETCI